MLKICKMLVVPLLLGLLLLSVATVAFYVTPHHCCSPANACIGNLRQIDGAKAMWAFEHGKQTNDAPAWTAIIGETNYLSRMPICPLGGTYILGSVGRTPVCTIQAHRLPRR